MHTESPDVGLVTHSFISNVYSSGSPLMSNVTGSFEGVGQHYNDIQTENATEYSNLFVKQNCEPTCFFGEGTEIDLSNE